MYVYTFHYTHIYIKLYRREKYIIYIYVATERRRRP